jgi:hypothetical protein
MGNMAQDKPTKKELQAMNAKLFSTAFVFAASISAAVMAQGPATTVTLAPFSGGAAGAAYADYGYSPLSSTAAGDFMRGSAAGIRAIGEAVRNGSEAAVNLEAAKKANLDNNYEAAQTYWEKRRLWAENNAYFRGNSLSQEQLRQLARDAAPSRLNVMQLSPATGEVNWPAALLRPEFDSFRTKVEEVLANRTVSNSGIGSSTETAITKLTNTMQGSLKAQIDEMTPNEYVVAKSFLRSLAHETRFMPGVEGIARR